ncbi:hypothetical protein K474DRAFT_1768664 [Panus rudis PR-1116 ss-1]|nr:hypothetical protein K474DRAFT_1768664 [Panus rudis PR-1116 ss-1]
MKISQKSKRPVAPPISQVADFQNKVLQAPTWDALADVLSQVETWKWPRSDLNAWVKVLDKLDEVLEQIIRDYEIDKIQKENFSPQTKRILSEILRFERLLLENSTNRKTYSSYDRLHSLMLTSDLDVLILSLNLLLRPAQQYSAQPAVLHALNISTPRLSSLAKRWPNLRESDLNFADLVGDKGKEAVEALPVEAREVHFTFYPKPSGIPVKKEATADADVFESSSLQTPKKGVTPGTGPSTTGPSTGAITVHIDSQTLASKPTMTVLAEAVERYSVPEDEKFELLCRIRAAQVLIPERNEEREKLVVVRLLATAIFCHTHPEGHGQSSLFIYEPELVSHVAEVLQIDRGIDIQIQTAAVTALDALGRYKGKISEVLTAVNAGVNHGILMALLRKTISQVAEPASNIPQSFVEALLSFVTFIATHASGGNMVVGAGLVPLLVQIIDIRLPQRLYVVSKAMQLVDNVLYGYTNAFQLFCNARGVDILVGRIEYEVDSDLEEFGEDKPAPDVSVPYGKLTVPRAAVLKHIMRSMQRMMQSSGASEGLRGLLDSTLLKSVKKILDHRQVFGPSVLPIAINIMATFVHNEPTCLNVIQEAGLPDSFYKVIESGLEPVIEVVQAVPHALGALCLNQTGIDQLTARPVIIPSFFSIFTSERHQRMLQEKENAVLIGTSIEELIRHHPPLKDTVFASIKTTLTKIEEVGNAFEIPDDIKQWYLLQPSTPSSASDPAATTTDHDIVMEEPPAGESQSAPAAPSAPAAEQPATEEDGSPKSHDNIITSYIDVFGRFLEGFFQHIPHCREFINSSDGLQSLGRLTALKCLPYDFPNSVASDSIVQVVRTMIESETHTTLKFLVGLVNESLAETREFREEADGKPKLKSLLEQCGNDLEKANEAFRKLITLHVRIMLLSDIYAVAGYQARAMTTLLQHLVGTDAKGILLDLAALHRVFVWDNILLKSDSEFSTVDVPINPETWTPLNNPVLTPGATTPSQTDIGTSSTANGVQAEASAPTTDGAVPSGSAEGTATSKKEDGPAEANIRALKYVANQIPNSLTAFFQSIVRLFQLRRNPDAAHKQTIMDAAGVISDIILQHLRDRTCDDKLSLFSYYTVMLGMASVLLFEDRGTQKSIHTVVLVAFYRKGGIDVIAKLCHYFVKSIEEIAAVKSEERTEAQTQELLHAHGGLKVVLHLLYPMILAKPLFESAQTALLATPDKNDTDPDYFEPHNFVVKLRLAVLPLMRDLWQSSWLTSAPLSVTKSVVQVVLELFNTENETKDPNSDPINGPAPTSAYAAALGVGVAPPRPVGPDENRIRQLMDMGFPRSAAERALVRARNNVNTAAELLLAHPFPFPPDPEPNEPAPAPAPAPAPEPEPEAQPAPAPAPAADAAPADAPADVPADVPVDTAPSDALAATEGQPPQPADTEAASTSPAEVSGSGGAALEAEAEPIAEPPKVGKSHEELLEELNTLRDPLKEGVGRRALSLVDEHPSLVFDIQRVFVGPNTGYRDQSIRNLLDDIKAFSPSAYEHQEHPIAVRLRLLALVLGEPSAAMAIPSNETKHLMDLLISLLLSKPEGHDFTSSPPKWLAAHLLVCEALLLLGEEPCTANLPKEDEPVVKPELECGPLYPEARNTLFELCCKLISQSTTGRDEQLSSLRLLILLTRDYKFASEFAKRNGVEWIFQCVKSATATATASGIHPYVAMLLRHIVEDPATLQHSMRQEIKRWFATPRNRLVDPSSYVRSCGSMALRDARAFIQVTEESCQLTNPFGVVKSIALKNDEKPSEQSPQVEGGDGTTEMQVDEHTSYTSSNVSDTLETTMHFLLSELIKTVKRDQSPEQPAPVPEDQTPKQPTDSISTEPITRPPPPLRVADGTDWATRADENQPWLEPTARNVDYVYSCFIMQCLTELLFSYDTSKVAFLSYSPRKRIHTPAKEGGLKHRTAALQFLLSDLITFGTINPQVTPEGKRQVMLCNWAMSVIVALCVDTFPTQDLKDIPSERVSIRKFVLEAVSRALKDIPASEGPDARYGRLLALVDLCYRLLSVRFNMGPRKVNDETPTHIAKIMLEKNFVATLTNALAEVDLNYPGIRTVVAGILRPLEYLTKVAIRMSRVSDKHKESIVEDRESMQSDTSSQYADDMIDADREETPDLYRNSSLGMYGGEMEDGHYPQDDEMDEEEEEEEDDVDMHEYDDETGSEDTSQTDEDEVDDIEEELENETGESEEGWHDEDEENDDLVENEDNEDEGEHDDEDEDEEGDEEVLWQDVAVGEDEMNDADIDGMEDADDAIPVMGADAEEEGDMSDAEDYDELGVLDMPNTGGATGIFATASRGGDPFVLDAFGPRNPQEVDELFWQGMSRPNRRRLEDDEIELFNRVRSTPPGPAPEAAVHPLLQDPSSSNARAGGNVRSTRRLGRVALPGLPQNLLQTIENAIGEGAVNLFHHIISQGRGAGETIRIDVPPGNFIPHYLQRHGRHGFSASIRLERAPRSGDRSSDHKSFEPLVTIQRWAEEAKTLHGKYEHSRLAKLANHVVLALLPAAIEAAKKAKIEEEKEAERQREAQAKAEEEAAAAAKAIEEEKARQEALRAEENARAAEEAAREAEQPATGDLDAEMTDAHNENSEGNTAGASEDTTDVDPGQASTSEAEPSAPQRVTVMIHGNPVDITDTGIDPTFLEALPDDMREEVLNQHVRDQRAARVERPADSQISPEFLDALPPELRLEIIQQENVERARNQTNIAPPNIAPADIDPASFIASLDPQLRQVILMDSDDALIASLPSHMVAEAGIYREQRHTPSHQHSHTRAIPAANQSSQKTPVPREAIQLLDKSAIAVLVRLLFFPEVLRKNLLSKVLVNLCENSRTRTDIFNLLLSILQDGTGDLASIDKSFAQLSFRNTRNTPQAPSKVSGKQRMSSDYFALPNIQIQSEIVPELVAQRCLEALTYIVGSNEPSSLFFLTEHELPAGLRRNTSRKGKGKERQAPQSHYPIVLLLSLLDRPSLLKTPSLMESLVALLALVTRPLVSLQDGKSKETAEKASSSSAVAASSSTEEVSTSTDPQATPVAPAPATDAQSTAAQPSEPATNQGSGSNSTEKALLTNPPAIPHHILKSVVNILTTGECSGRAFSHTLALIQHLSHIPEAKEVIAQELRLRAQEFGQRLYESLDELARALQESREEDVTTAIASKFSPASSDQAKLLRILKTIDYMYSPKQSSTSTASTPDQADVEKLQSIYESFKFTALWRRLGDCLAIIEEKPELEHIATVLLPLIESLMVVCKYVGSSSATGASARLLRAPMSPKSPTSPRDTMEELFVNFTDAHRKVLNLMVRNNPSLMSGSFSLLVHNPRVLEFDNKRNYFNQQLHRRPSTREHYGTLQLNVRRQRVFEDSFQYLQRKTGEQIKYGKLSVRFYDEEGVDAGGVTREWFQILARQMFDPNYALFQPCAADKLTYQPNRASWVNPEHLSFFKFVGRVIGKAIYDGRLLDAYFARSLYKQILGKPVDYRDVEFVDPEYYNSLCWILENDPTPLELTFSIEADEFGVMKLIELKEGGANIPVTNENKREFVQLSAQHRLYSSIKDQIESLLAGFYEIIPKELVQIFDEKELELLISGTPDIDVDEWRSATEYNGYTSSDPVIVWFWRALKSFNREEKAKVLSFATGTSRVPLGGFAELQGVQGNQKFSIHKAYGDPDRLPQAHTCFNQIDLPQYSSYEMLRQQLLLAINEGGEGFGFA